ncbi:MAG TPA: hypothetical protein VLH39_03150 [Magnetospirillaceae bacterium]|nr:hypothetical protein [Magnetospirillaceae bacterium]
MPIRLLFLTIVMVLLAAFIGFNLENRCDVSFAFFTLQDVPVVVTILSSFSLGLVAALPFALRSRKSKAQAPGSPKRPRPSPDAEQDASPKDERFPDPGPP